MKEKGGGLSGEEARLRAFHEEFQERWNRFPGVGGTRGSFGARYQREKKWGEAVLHHSNWRGGGGDYEEKNKRGSEKGRGPKC